MELMKRPAMLVRWTFRLGIGAALAVLRLLTSPGASGNPRDEFRDLVPVGRPEDAPTAPNKSDAFWSMYYQAHSPRLWRMRRLFTLSSRPGGDPKEGSERE